MARFVPMQKPSAFRKWAAAAWPRPHDPTILGMVDVDYSAAARFIAAYDRQFGTALTPTHLVGRAVGLLLARHPETNAIIGLTGIRLRPGADVFFMIDSENGRNLTGHKLDAVDGLPLARIEAELRETASEIRAGNDRVFGQGHARLRRAPLWLVRRAIPVNTFLANRLGIDLSPRGPAPDPFGGAIVTALGKFGVETAFAALVPHSLTGIVIAVMQVRDMPWVVGHAVEPRPVLRICATTDHRIIDGQSGGRFLADLKALLADPEGLLTPDEAEAWRAPR